MFLLSQKADGRADNQKIKGSKAKEMKFKIASDHQIHCIYLESTTIGPILWVKVPPTKKVLKITGYRNTALARRKDITGHKFSQNSTEERKRFLHSKDLVQPNLGTISTDKKPTDLPEIEESVIRGMQTGQRLAQSTIIYMDPSPYQSPYQSSIRMQGFPLVPGYAIQNNQIVTNHQHLSSRIIHMISRSSEDSQVGVACLLIIRKLIMWNYFPKYWFFITSQRTKVPEGIKCNIFCSHCVYISQIVFLPRKLKDWIMRPKVRK